ncbi:MAG: hypothetical protein ABIO92_10150, partial [Chloroflexia bacterium]
YQLAFALYAVASLSQRTPAYRAPYAEAMRGAIGKMLDVASWGYWRAPSPSNEQAGTSHLAVLASPHQRLPAGPPSDPIARDNLQYSGHLSTMLGLYEKLTGDHQYDNPFTLHDPHSGATYTYTHSEVAERLYNQMKENRFGGVCCEPGMAYVPCNNYAMASNTLHDALHGTRYSEANDEWLHTVEKKMVLKGPALRGIFGASYVKDIGLATPVAFNFTDAWGLAFLLPFHPTLVRKMYPVFRKRVTRAGMSEAGVGAYIGSSSFSDKTEISDVAINTGLGLILARAIGDTRLAGTLHRYSASEFGITWDGNRLLYKTAPRTFQSTALYALAHSIQSDSTTFSDLFTAPPTKGLREQPYLESISDSSGNIGVSRAEYNPSEQALYIALHHVGDPALISKSSAHDITLCVKQLKSHPIVQVEGNTISDTDYTYTEDGNLSLTTNVIPGKATDCIILEET